MKYTDRFREKYATRDRLNIMDPYDVQTKYTPAGAKDVRKLCDAVDSMTKILEDEIVPLDYAYSGAVRNRFNMILMRLGER